VPCIAAVLLVVVEAVLVTPLYVGKRHGSGLRCCGEGVNAFQIETLEDESGDPPSHFVLWRDGAERQMLQCQAPTLADFDLGNGP
jgi:hypothetical protein